MHKHLGLIAAFLAVLQSLLLLLLYQPLPSGLESPAFDIIYNYVFISTSVALLGLAYVAFRRRRILLGLLTVVLAFPGILFWTTVLGSLLANRAVE